MRDTFLSNCGPASKMLGSRVSLFSVLHCGAVCCSVLHCVVVCCRVLPCVAVCCSVLQCVAVCCSVLQCVEVYYNVLKSVAVRCNVFQCAALCCSMSGSSVSLLSLTLPPHISGKNCSLLYICMHMLTHT